MEDFDVVLAVDTQRGWYQSEGKALGDELRHLSEQYARVVFLGVSMGGNAALRYAHLADLVLVFAAQVVPRSESKSTVSNNLTNVRFEPIVDILKC